MIALQGFDQAVAGLEKPSRSDRRNVSEFCGWMLPIWIVRLAGVTFAAAKVILGAVPHANLISSLSVRRMA